MNPIPGEDENRYYDFHLMMVMQCAVCCIIRELFGLTREAYGKLICKSASGVRKFEAGTLADGHDDKEVYNRTFLIGVDFSMRLCYLALLFYWENKIKIMGDRATLRIAYGLDNPHNDDIVAYAKDLDSLAMRLSVLFSIAHLYKLDIKNEEKAFFQQKIKLYSFQRAVAHQSFLNSVETAEFIERGFKKEQLKLVLPKIEYYTKKTVKKRREMQLLLDGKQV